MKKSMLLLSGVLLITCLATFGFNNWTGVERKCSTSPTAEVALGIDLFDWNNIESDVDLIYKVDHRFATSVTKEMLHNAKSIIDILPENATKSVETYQNARVSILHDELETTEMGDGDLLNAAQRELLLTTDYSTNIRITSICQKRNGEGNLEEDSLVYYMTVIPEKVAEFTGGHQALIKYLRENSRETVAIIKEDERQASKINFTVTKKGTIADVKMTGTTGYSSVDKALIELITHMPEKWTPATNSRGDKVDQELVFFFGLQGC